MRRDAIAYKMRRIFQISSFRDVGQLKFYWGVCYNLKTICNLEKLLISAGMTSAKELHLPPLKA